MYTRCFGVGELILGLEEAFLDGFFLFGASAAETRLEGAEGGGGWRDEDVAGGERGCFDLFNSLERGVLVESKEVGREVIVTQGC